MKKYTVIKILNNSVVQCIAENESQEFIAKGNGLSFKIDAGGQIDESDIESMYFKSDKKNRNQYINLIERCDPELIDAVEEIIHKMEIKFGKCYDEYIHIALLDHLNFSLYRLKNNIEVKNILVDEYRFLYKKEFEFSEEIVKFINDRLNVKLPQSEVGFLTLHFHSALHNERVSKTSLYMEIIASCMKLLEKELNMKIEPSSVEGIRLVTHLKFALQRVRQKIDMVNPVLEALKSNYSEIYQIAVKIAKMLKENYDIDLPEGELGYLVLHIQNIVMTLKTNKKVRE